MSAIAAIAAAVLVLDQVTKAMALRLLELGLPVPVIDGFFSLTLVMNPGPRLRHARPDAAGLALDRGALLSIGGSGGAAGRSRAAWCRRAGRLSVAGAGADLRRRRRQPDRSRALRRGGGLPRLLLARLPLARLQRGRLRITVGVALLAFRMVFPGEPRRMPARGARVRERPGERDAGPSPRRGEHMVAGEPSRRRGERYGNAVDEDRRVGEVGARLDRWLSARLADLSRMRIKALVEAGHVRVGGRRSKAAYRLRGRGRGRRSTFRRRRRRG